MAEISKIKLPSGTEYYIKDATARATLAGAIKIKGTTTTALTDEATTNPITIDGSSYTAVANDAVFYSKKEFVFDGTKWHFQQRTLQAEPCLFLKHLQLR